MPGRFCRCAWGPGAGPAASGVTFGVSGHSVVDERHQQTIAAPETPGLSAGSPHAWRVYPTGCGVAPLADQWGNPDNRSHPPTTPCPSRGNRRPGLHPGRRNHRKQLTPAPEPPGAGGITGGGSHLGTGIPPVGGITGGGSHLFAGTTRAGGTTGCSSYVSADPRSCVLPWPRWWVSRVELVRARRAAKRP